jgi:hypothetical protein
MKPISFLLALVVFFLCSCSSKELTREKAKQALLDKYHFPNHEEKEFQAFMGYDATPKERRPWDQLVQEGLLSYQTGESGWYLFASITDKGMEYVTSQRKEGPFGNKAFGMTNVYKLRTCEVSFLNVTGIQQIPNENKAEVVYSVQISPTPFGKHLFKLSDGELSRKATFKKYDDGWRLEDQISEPVSNNVR